MLVVPGGMCTTCPEGMTEEKPCAVDANRVCKPCQASCQLNEFEATSCTQATDRVCQKCSACPQSYVKLSDCTNVTDTVCVPAVSLRAGKVAPTRITARARQFVPVEVWATTQSNYPSMHARGPTDMFDLTSGIFTCPLTGYYWVSNFLCLWPLGCVQVNICSEPTQFEQTPPH